jgi:hypothetical protein
VIDLIEVLLFRQSGTSPANSYTSAAKAAASFPNQVFFHFFNFSLTF